MRREFLLLVVVCICVGLLVTPCLAAQPVTKSAVKIEKIKGEYHVGDTLVVSGTTKNIRDGTTIDLNFESPQHAVVPISAYVDNNRYTATINTAYLGAGTWSVWASTPFEYWAYSKTVYFTVLP